MQHRALALLLLWLVSLPAWGQPRVVVSIAPLHSLTAGVMAGVGQPPLLLPPGSSPHTYALLPSDARALQAADLVIWVGEGLEVFLRKPLTTLTAPDTRLAVAELPGLTLLPARSGPDWEGHDHDHHGHDGDAHGIDWHLWLDPRNAAVVVTALGERLAALDPANAGRYRDNAQALTERLQALDRELAERLAPLRGRAYMVFHDAYQYFEHRYGLTSIGAITVSPERLPGARRVAEIRAELRQRQVRCLFREPQFEPSLVQAIVRGSDVRVGVLDPEGADLAPGPELYFALLRALGANLSECLQRSAGSAP